MGNPKHAPLVQSAISREKTNTISNYNSIFVIMKAKKIFLWILGSLLVILGLVLFFLSTFIKGYVEDKADELIGRKIQIAELHINYAKVSVDVIGFVLYESNAVDTFVAFDQLYINYQPWKLLQNEYALSEFLLDGIFINVEQDSTGFNFDDMIPPTDTLSTDTVASTTEEDVRFSFENISIKNGQLRYFDKAIDNLLSFHNLNIQLPLIAWNKEQSNAGVEFNIGEKGHLAIDATINNTEETYAFRTKVDSLDLNPFSSYLHNFMNTTGMEGLLYSDIKIAGSMVDYMNIVVEGEAQVNDFKLMDTTGISVVGAKNLAIRFDSLDMKNQYYHISSIQIDSPTVLAILDTASTNFEQLFAPVLETDSSPTDTVATVDSTLTETGDSIPVRYRIDSVIINKGLVDFTDKTLNREFDYSLSEIDFAVKGISERADSIPVRFSIILNEGGMFSGSSSFSMLNSYDLFFKGSLENLDLSSFSPYSEYYIAYPITQGEFSYDCQVAMTATDLKNDNKIRISELDFGKKTSDTTAMKRPIRLALYILKDKDDQIEIDLPVWGNPSDPDFAIGKLVWKTFSKFIVKTASEPFSALASLAGTNPESIEQVTFELTQDSLASEQKATLDKLAEILEKKPNLVFSLKQETSIDVETKQLAYKEACSDFLFTQNETENKRDSLIIEKNWITVDSTGHSFVQFLNSKTGLGDTLSIMDKCQFLFEEENPERMARLLDTRNQAILDYLVQTKKVNHSSIIVRTADLKNIRIENEKPIFRVEVSLK